MQQSTGFIKSRTQLSDWTITTTMLNLNLKLFSLFTIWVDYIVLVIYYILHTDIQVFSRGEILLIIFELWKNTNVFGPNILKMQKRHQAYFFQGFFCIFNNFNTFMQEKNTTCFSMANRTKMKTKSLKEKFL